MKKILLIILCLGIIGCAGITKKSKLEQDAMTIQNLEAKINNLEQVLIERDEGIKNLQNLLEEKEASIEELHKKLEMFGVFEK